MISANAHMWGAVAAVGDEWHVVEPREIVVLDRIGGGDGFASGLIYGMLEGRELDDVALFEVEEVQSRAGRAEVEGQRARGGRGGHLQVQAVACAPDIDAGGGAGGRVGGRAVGPGEGAARVVDAPYSNPIGFSKSKKNGANRAPAS